MWTKKSADPRKPYSAGHLHEPQQQPKYCMDVSKRYNEMKNSPLAHNDLFLVDPGRIPSATSEDCHTALKSFLRKEMGKSTLVFIVEYCSDCSKHNTSLRHDPQKYLRMAHEILRSLMKALNDMKLNFQMGAMAIPVESETRIGAMDVFLAFRHDDIDSLSFQNIYSKLKTKVWPVISAVEKNTVRYILGSVTPILGIPASAASGEVSTNGDSIELNEVPEIEPGKYKISWFIDRRNNQVTNYSALFYIFLYCSTSS